MFLFWWGHGLVCHRLASQSLCRWERPWTSDPPAISASHCVFSLGISPSFHGAGDWTQRFVYSRQALCQPWFIKFWNNLNNFIEEHEKDEAFSESDERIVAWEIWSETWISRAEMLLNAMFSGKVGEGAPWWQKTFLAISLFQHVLSMSAWNSSKGHS